VEESPELAKLQTN